MYPEKQLIAINFFTGFYGSFHGAQFDFEIESYFEDAPENAQDNTDYTCDFKRYAESFVNCLNSEVNLNLEFESLESPKYYNFTTDRIFCNITPEDSAKLEVYKNSELFKTLLKENFRSREGFASFYSAEIEAYQKPLAEFDLNELGILLDCYCFDAYKTCVETEAGFTDTSATIDTILQELDEHLSTEVSAQGGVVVNFTEIKQQA